MARHITKPMSILEQKLINLRDKKLKLKQVLAGQLVVTGQEPETRDAIERIKHDIAQYIDEISDRGYEMFT